MGGTPQPPSCPIDLDKGAFDIIRLIKLDGSNIFIIKHLRVCSFMFAPLLGP